MSHNQTLALIWFIGMVLWFIAGMLWIRADRPGVSALHFAMSGIYGIAASLYAGLL